MRALSKFLALFLIVSTLMVFVFGTTTSNQVSEAENIHADLVVITSIDRETHEVFAVNCNGKTVVFEEDDDWYVGDYAIVVFKFDSDSEPYDGEVILTLYERPDLVAHWGSEFGIDSET